MLFFVAVARATSISVNLLWENPGISSLTVKSAVNIKALLSFVFRSDWYEEVPSFPVSMSFWCFWKLYPYSSKPTKKYACYVICKGNIGTWDNNAHINTLMDILRCSVPSPCPLLFEGKHDWKVMKNMVLENKWQADFQLIFRHAYQTYALENT